MYSSFGTEVLGVGPGALGAIFFASKLWDAVSDPIALPGKVCGIAQFEGCAEASSRELGAKIDRALWSLQSTLRQPGIQRR